MKILIVEDDPFVAEDLQEKLEGLRRYQVTGIAESYGSALESIRENKPDLALVDIELKGDLTGIDLSEQLNKLAIPFIYLSSKQDLEMYFKAENTGPLKNLSKPIDSYNLRNALLEVEPLLAAAQQEVMHFFTAKGGIRKRIEADQIVYLQAARSYCDVYFGDGTKWELSIAMGTAMKKLNHTDLIQISRFHCINKKHIQHIQGKKVQLIVGPFLKVSDSCREEFNRMVNKV